MPTVRQSWPRGTEDKNQIFLSALKKAWEAGWRAAAAAGDDGECQPPSESDLWDFDVTESPAVGKAKRAPATPSPKKPKGDPEELSKLEYDKKKCRARKFNVGWPLQCWKIPGEEGGVCHLCEARQADSTQDFWGFYDEPLEDCCLSKDGKPHAWKSLAKSRAEKKASDRAEKKEMKEQEKRRKEEEKEKVKAAKKVEKEKKEKEKLDKRQKKKSLKAAAKKAAVKKAAEEKAEENAAAAEEKGEENAAAVEEKAEVGVELGVDLPRAEEIDHGPSEEEKKETAEDSPDSGEELEEDTQPLDDPVPEEVFEEYIHDGYTMKWNKVTNDLLDPDDDEILGKMTFDDEGNPTPEINEDDSDDSDEE